MTTIALAAMGEMGAAIGARIVSSGGRSLACLEGRTQASIDRARDAGVEADTTTAIVERADIYLSIVPPAVAEQVADRFLDVAATATRVPVFIDCNAVAPVTLARIAARFTAAGLRFGDGGIVGGPPRRGDAGPRLYLSGAIEDVTMPLREYGLDARYLSDVPGDASALKMSYAGLTKGLQALAAGVLTAAGDAAILDPLIAEVRQSLPGLYDFLATTLPKMPRKAGRWEQEMREIALFLQANDGAAAIFVGAADAYREVAKDASQPSPTLPPLIDRFVARRSNL